MNHSIAIIGISFELPGMKDWIELSQSLGKKEVKIGALPPGRLQDFQNKYGPVEMSTGGYLERIDLFDNTCFDMTEREAMKAFPEHRFFLQHALRAFYDAGYTAKDIKQSNTGIFISPSRSQYPPYLNGQYDFFDTLTGIEATRLARFLDIRGPVMSVNTTCSSSLMAVHTACSSLEQNECNMALVGGVKLGVITKESTAGFVVISRKGECRPFDKDADGMINGEGVICMLLKRLEDAERDNDPIYATIAGRAVNHGGARITSLTAPSIEAQKEVILKAWEQAGIAPGDMKFIEVHGTGTILGDPIEFGGIHEAFASKGISAPTCKISSVKAQIGHLDTMCGMAGLLRLIAALNNKIIPAQANFTNINEHIDETGSAVQVQREPEYWETDNGIRTGGVSSYGLTGTNVHMVLTHKEVKTRVKNQESHYFLQIGEPTKDRLEKLKQQLIQFLEADPSVDLKTFSDKINRLYEANKYSEGVIFSDRAELLHELRKSANQRVEEAAFFLLDLDILSYDPGLIKNIFAENNLIKKCWEDVIGKAWSPESIADGAVLNVLFQYVLYKYLLSLLGNKLRIITRQGEGVLQALLNNKLQPAALINDPGLISSNQPPFNRQHFENYLHKNFAQQQVVLIDFSGENDMHFPDAGNVITINGAFHAKARYQLYKELLTVNKEPLRSPNVPVPLPSIQLPVYQLTRFWPKNTPNPNTNNTVNKVAERSEEQPKVILSVEEIMTRVQPIWQKILELEQDITPTDDFFELGGDSLSGLDMLSQLSKEFKVTVITYEEMFSFSKLDKLCTTIQERLAPKHILPEIKSTQVAANDAAERKEHYTELLEAIRNNQPPDKIIHKDILITGATGLLGSFLVKRIADTTDANIICLVRGRDDQEANVRFWEVYQESFGITQDERIKVIHGDLTNEFLFKELPVQQSLQQVSTVYHAAGSPAYVGSPDLTNHINYKGTKHIYDWAVENKIPYFNYISTIGVTGQAMPEHIDAFYETDLNLGQETKNYVHSGSKLMTEEYLLNHRSPDTIVNTFRISNLGGRSTDGFTRFNMNKNLMYLKLQRVVKAGFYSDKSLTYNLNFKIVPVDIQAAAICELSFYRHQFLNTFHLSLEEGFTIGEIINAFDKNNIAINRVEHDRFLEQIDKWQESMEDHSVNLMRFGGYDKNTKNTYRIIADATRLTLKKIKAEIYYDRSDYLSNVVNYCIKERFLSTNIHLAKT